MADSKKLSSAADTTASASKVITPVKDVKEGVVKDETHRGQGGSYIGLGGGKRKKV